MTTITIFQIITLLSCMVGTTLLNRLKGIPSSELPTALATVKVPLVYVTNGLFASMLAFSFHLPIAEILIAFLAGSIGYAIFRQKGPTLAWLGGIKKWNLSVGGKPNELPQHIHIDKLLWTFHGLSIRQIPFMTKHDLKRMGNIGGAYRGFIYAIPMIMLMMLIHPLGAFLGGLTSLLLGVIFTFSGVDGYWGKEEGMIGRGELISGAMIVFPMYGLPILARGLGSL